MATATDGCRGQVRTFATKDLVPEAGVELGEKQRSWLWPLGGWLEAA
jgi:hypothetical protein